MKADYVIFQGEELYLSLIAIDGDTSNVTTVSAVLKPAGPNGSVPSLSTPSSGIFNVFPTTQLGSVGWDFVLSGDQTLDLKPGYYVTNAKLDLISGGPLKTDPVLIEIRPSVT